MRPSASLALLAVIAVTACGAGYGARDYSTALVRTIRIDGAGRIERTTGGSGHAGRATIDEAHCVQRAGTQRYSCRVKYSYHDSEGTYEYELRVSGTCERGGRCRWHPDSNGALISAEPE